jgi:hypothetical protein
MGPTGCPETSVWNYYYMLHNNNIGMTFAAKVTQCVNGFGICRWRLELSAPDISLVNHKYEQ